MLIRGRLLIDPARPPTPGWIEVEGPRIAAMGDGDPPRRADLGGPDCVICPGFIDAHLHLPQFESIGYDGQELLPWLEQVIFPAESRWADPAVARRQIEHACGRLLESATTGFAGFLTSHAHAVEVASTATAPLRAIAGQALMDREAPAALLGHDLAPLANGPDGRFAASVNPRFAVSCTDALLEHAATLAAGGAFVQTHLAESAGECARVAELFPRDASYTAVYDRHGLLHDRTLLAHCLHLAPDEWALIAARRSVVVHCPGANTFLRSGLFDLRAARDHGIRLALGSDVAAGPDLPMPRVARRMIEVAKLRALTVQPDAVVPSPAEAWSMITAGNADALGWPDAGRLEIDAAADLLVLEPPFPIDEHLVSRLIYTWRNRFVRHRIVGGGFPRVQPPC